MRLALYEPDIPQNTGTIIRLAACMGVPVDIIEPCGFAFSEKSFRRSGLDYVEMAEIEHHMSFDHFESWREKRGSRLVLLTTKAEQSYTAYEFSSDDIILMGRESAGVPDAVHSHADDRITIPMPGKLRSLNVALAAAMVLGEALRQLKTHEE